MDKAPVTSACRERHYRGSHLADIRTYFTFAAAFVAAALALSADLQAKPRAIATVARGMTPTVARCLIRREPELVRRWLQTLPGTVDEKSLIARGQPRFAACFDPYAQAAGGWIESYEADGMRAALVRATLQSRREELLRAPAPPAGPQNWYGDASGRSPEAISGIVAADLGICLARKRWVDVVALISAVDPAVEKLDFVVLTRWRSTQQREATKVDEIIPRFFSEISSCVPAGLTLRLDRQKLRALVEEAAYHLTDDGAGSSDRDRSD